MARLRQIVDLPEMNFFAFAVLLNFAREFLQVPLFEGMADARHWDAIRICTRATLGDGLISSLRPGPPPPDPPNPADG